MAKGRNWPPFNNYVGRRSLSSRKPEIEVNKIASFQNVNRGLSIMSVFESGFILGVRY